MNQPNPQYDKPIEELREEYYSIYPNDKQFFEEGIVTDAISRRVSKFLKSHEEKHEYMGLIKDVVR